MTEVWKDVVGYEGYYQVSNFGNVRSCDRMVKSCKNGKRIAKGRTMKKTDTIQGYRKVVLCRDAKRKNACIHRLVAQAFIPNPKNYPQVNHKDEIKTNNCVDNLEWCDHDYNMHYGNISQKMREKSRKIPVNQLDLDGNALTVWRSIRDAEIATNIDRSSIIRVCKGKQHTAGGYKWEYAQ